MTDLDGRIALVTGGAVRIGRVIALALARAGADVAVHYRRSRREAERTAAEIEALGRRATLVQAELADGEAPARLLAEAAAALGPVDLLVNNASLFTRTDLAGTGLGDWAPMMRVNLRAPLLLAQAMAANLPPERRGDIVNLNDVHALAPRTGAVPYLLSKHGLHGLTRNLALELAPRIKVNEVALGAVLPPAAPPDGYVHTPRARIPLDRFPTPDDVADAVLFLVRSPAVTGLTIAVDGGEHLHGGGAP